MKIIAVGHRRFVGKDTAVKFAIHYIKTELKLHVVKRSFATELKAICYKLFNDYGLLSTDYYEKYPEQKDIPIPLIGMSAREIWIKVGNDMREICPYVWLNITLKAQADVLLLTDLRYPNEADAIHELGGQIIRIDRNVPKHSDAADSALEGYKDWDYVIENNGTLNNLHKDVVWLVKEILND